MTPFHNGFTGPYIPLGRDPGEPDGNGEAGPQGPAFSPAFPTSTAKNTGQARRVEINTPKVTVIAHHLWDKKAFMRDFIPEMRRAMTELGENLKEYTPPFPDRNHKTTVFEELTI